MLVLGRRESERIFIGDDISVMVCSIRGNSVRIGISAPDHLNIVREELRHPPALVLDLDAAQELAEGAR